MEERAQSSPSPRSAACITGISEQLEVGSVKLFPITDRQQIHSKETAWHNQIGSPE
jgi:hypothetical protein